MQHFLSLYDHSADELMELLDLAVFLKREWQTGGNRPVLAGKVLGMVFMKPSLRTRVSFEVGMKHLGGDAIYLSPNEISMGQRESIPDVARVLSGYVQGIMARVFDHAHVTELAQWSRVPVINGLSDYSHPCQIMADGLTILEHFGTLKDLKIAYVGDSNNVTRSLIFFAAKLGLTMSIASPNGYTMDDETLSKARAIGGELIITSDPAEGVKDADVIYTDTWTSMGQEAEAAERRKVFPPYQVNAGLLKKAASRAVVMHCLPAHRGEEITDEVADGKQSVIFPQAENRLHAQKAILVKLLQ